MRHEAEDFFSRFEEANNGSNFAVFNQLYADRFMFGGPNGIQIVERDAFLKVIPKIKAQLSSMGLFQSQVEAVEPRELDSKYLLVKVSWWMGVRTSSGNNHIDAFATFVLARGPAGALSIVFQIDHQDLSTVIKTQQEPEIQCPKLQAHSPKSD
jgi:hypothetical protein